MRYWTSNMKIVYAYHVLVHVVIPQITVNISCCSPPGSLQLLKGNLMPLQWRHNERDSVSNHQPHDYLLNCLFRCRSKKTSKLRVTGLCERNSPVTGEFPAQRASNAENVSIWWCHHETIIFDSKDLTQTYVKLKSSRMQPTSNICISNPVPLHV